jgi:hypothetical protein
MFGYVCCASQNQIADVVDWDQIDNLLFIAVQKVNQTKHRCEKYSAQS